MRIESIRVKIFRVNKFPFLLLLIFSACSHLTKQPPPEFLSAPFAAKALQGVQKIGYIYECDAIKREKEKDQHEFCSSFSEKFHLEKDLNQGINEALHRQMPQFQWISLREFLKESDSFKHCYSQFLIFENLKFDDCLNDQESKEKIQKKYNVDALAHLVIKISSKSESKLSLKSFTPGVKDEVLHIDTSYYFKIVKYDSIKPVWIQVGSNYEGRENSHLQFGSFQLKSHDSFQKEDPFVARAEMFFVDIKKSLGI